MAKSKRHGKHRQGKIRIQISVDRDVKAILVYTASILNRTLTDLLVGEGLRTAFSNGIVDAENNVNPEHAAGVEYVKDLLKAQEGDK